MFSEVMLAGVYLDKILEADDWIPKTHEEVLSAKK